MNDYVSGAIGMIHLVSSMMAVVLGTVILLIKKGTRKHKRIGYGYVLCMVILLITSFMLYNLFGGFGIFHVAAILSSITLAKGMIPVIRKRRGWVLHHLSWMYWSVIGLYAAFLSEVFTRVLPTPFFIGVGIGTALIMGAGSIGFRRNIKKWQKQFSTT